MTPGRGTTFGRVSVSTVNFPSGRELRNCRFATVLPLSLYKFRKNPSSLRRAGWGWRGDVRSHRASEVGGHPGQHGWAFLLHFHREKGGLTRALGFPMCCPPDVLAMPIGRVGSTGRSWALVAATVGFALLKAGVTFCLFFVFDLRYCLSPLSKRVLYQLAVYRACAATRSCIPRHRKPN